MPNKCTRCGKVYEEGSDVILKGCECGNRLFLYFRKLSDREADRLEKKTKDTAGLKGLVDISKGEPHLKKGNDVWNIRVKDGVYEIDVASLMLNEPVIVAGEEGRYLVSLSSAFKQKKELKRRG